MNMPGWKWKRLWRRLRPELRLLTYVVLFAEICNVALAIRKSALQALAMGGVVTLCADGDLGAEPVERRLEARCA